MIAICSFYVKGLMRDVEKGKATRISALVAQAHDFPGYPPETQE